MSDKVAGVEASAINILKRAVECDQARRFGEAMVCYREGLELLLTVMKDKSTDEKKRQHLRQKVTEYMERAEQLKSIAEQEKEAGQYHEQIHVESGSKGHSYEQVFKRFLDDTLTEVHIEDPYIRNIHQVYNLLRLCELLIKHAPRIKTVHLTTGKEENHSAFTTQESRLNELSSSLKHHGINLIIEYSSTLHDREIRFNNGWIVKIGRGLDYFRPTHGKFAIGYCDMDLRECHETTIDIFHSKHTKSSEPR